MTHAAALPISDLVAPREGTPAAVDTMAALTDAARRLAGGTGPVAIDAERASGYRYTGRAYLIQLRRAGSGTVLIDPLPFADLSSIARAIAGEEWIVHAASQDLPCLAELGLRPSKLFDTELGGRLAGFERVSLALMTERLLGFRLEKGYAAADWSTRPLPENWLTYAALDVELLLELAQALRVELDSLGKLGWAEQEFAAVAAATPPAPRAEPWRRTSGIHHVHGGAGLARVRALWEARDEIAQHRDTAPGRILPDSAIVAAAQENPSTERELFALPVFGNRTQRQQSSVWLTALRSARSLPAEQLPVPTPAPDSPPPGYRWADKDPEAAARLARGREAIQLLSVQHRIPNENLLAPDVLRRLAWRPVEPSNEHTVAASLSGLGARAWQVGLVSAALADALNSDA
ncbi:MAG: HRDC domain-containing protein [Mycobacteriales bacterium]